jgi:hypothetical protein
MERVTIPSGYVLGDEQSAEDILAVQEDLLRSEGIDPRWPGFDAPAAEQDNDRATDSR